MNSAELEILRTGHRIIEACLQSLRNETNTQAQHTSTVLELKKVFTEHVEVERALFLAGGTELRTLLVQHANIEGMLNELCKISPDSYSWDTFVESFCMLLIRHIRHEESVLEERASAKADS